MKMVKEKIVLIGGGDHCGNCIDTIDQEGKYEIAGIIDKPEKLHQKILGYEIFATDNDIPFLTKEYRNFFISIGQIKNPKPRENAFENILKYNVTIPVIISPLAYVTKNANIGEGTIIMPFAVIDVNVTVGRNCIIQYYTMLSHGAVMEDHCHVSVNCVLGKCNIGKGTFIGVNSWINNGVTIPPYTIIGSASNVLKTIEEPGIYAGNPSRRIK